MRRASYCLPIFLLFVCETLSAVVAPDPSMGVCTRQDEFQKRLEAMDQRVSSFTAENDEGRRKEQTAALAAAADTDIECLIRYREPALAPVFAEIVRNSKNWFIRTRALYALKMLGDAAGAAAAIEALDDEESMVREAAANALGRIAGDDARKALEKRLESEQDPYVKATIESALALAEGKISPFAPEGDDKTWKEELVGPEGAKRVANVWVNKGQTSFNVYDAKTLDYGDAKRFVYPVQRYKEDFIGGYPRNSFGAGGMHAGEDCAWLREGSSIYAVADGLVRMVQGAGGDWGFLIVIEHRLNPHQYITSVYGHCGADVLVAPGQTVKAGQRIATQGLSCSVENGGYGSHLHFGVGNGPFRRPMGMAAGDKINLSLPDGKTEAAPILSIVYSDAKKNAAGWPGLAVIVRKADGTAFKADIPEQDAQKEISWLQAYVKNCRGWLNPQLLLPKLVEGK